MSVIDGGVGGTALRRLLLVQRHGRRARRQWIAHVGDAGGGIAESRGCTRPPPKTPGCCRSDLACAVSHDLTQVAGLVAHAAAGGAGECCELRALEPSHPSIPQRALPERLPRMAGEHLPYTAGELRATVLPETSSGDFKFKVMGVLLSKDVLGSAARICRDATRMPPGPVPPAPVCCGSQPVKQKAPRSHCPLHAV